MPELRVRGYAKINLTLEITGRRCDGYHLLRSVMQSVSLFDTVFLQRADDGISFYCDDPLLPRDRRNTVVRAAELFYGTTGITPKIKLELFKGIPYEAGLGSGSAGASAALTGLNALYGNPLSMKQLLQLGLQVGADVPFALTGGTCLVEGIGESLTRLPQLADCRILIAKPIRGISTQEAYRCFDELESPKSHDSMAMITALDSCHLPDVCREIHNALEQVCILPEVFSLKSILLRLGALGAGMSGSGSAVFGIFPENTKASIASRLAADLQSEGTRFFWTRPVPCGTAVSCFSVDS